MDNKQLNHWAFAFKFWIAAIVIAFLAWLVIELLPIISLAIVAFLVVYCFLPLVNYLAKHNIPNYISTIISFLTIILAIGLLFYLLIPALAQEISYLGTYISHELLPYLDNLPHQLEHLDRLYNLQLSQNLADFLSSILNEIPNYLQRILENFSSFAESLFSGIWLVVACIFVIFYMLIYADNTREQFTALIPNYYQENIKYILEVINEKVGGYVRGTVVKSIVVGLLTGIAISILGVPFAIVLGFLAGLLNIILYIGPILAAVPAVLISFAPDTPHFLLVILIYLLVQGIDSFILTPFLLGQAVDLNPLTIILTVLIGAQLAGVFGIIIAIPLAAIGKVLFYHYYVPNLKKYSPEESDAQE